MSTEAQFTELERNALAEAPHLAGIAVMIAGSSGIFGSLKEAAVAAQSVFHGSESDNPLIRSLAAKETMQAAGDRIRAELGDYGDQDPKVFVRDKAVAKLRQAAAILRAKSPGDLGSYSEWVLQIGDKVANAAKEGSFLGFGGARVSESETAAIADIRSALAGQPS
ncbi:MAG: hypothetical protein R2729_18245 [Bryobacteraceae bacterium]